MPRKYSTKDAPVVGAAVDFLNNLADAIGCGSQADGCRAHADALYEYMARNLQRRGAMRSESERKARNLSIIMRGYQKRIAELEEKLLLIRTSTDLMERGLRTSDAGSGGQCVRMKRRIDHLEAKLLIIRELSDTTVGKRKDALIPEKERQIHEARIRVDVEKGLHGRRVPVINPAKVKLLEKAVSK
jgi:hypothetical protein